MSKIYSILLLCCVLITSCTSRNETPSDTLVVAINAQPSTLDPRFALDANGMRIAGLLFTPLVNIGSNLEIEPAAAESWTYSNNTYIFKIKPHLQFSNGRPVTKEDILFTFAEYLKPSSPFASALAPIEKVDVIEKEGRLEVIIKLKYFSAKFLRADLPSVKILPKAEVESAGSDYVKKLVGSGQFKLVNHDLNEVSLVAADNDLGRASKIKKILFKVIRDDYTRFQKTMKGEVDVAQTELPFDKIAEFEKKGDQFKVLKFPGLSMTYLLLNFKDPILKDKEVRIALAEALNREEIIKYKLSGMALPATSVLTPNNPYFNPNLQYPTFDLEAAKKAIAKAGLVGKTIILKSSNNPQSFDNAKVIAYQLSQTGLKVELQTYEWGTFFDDIKKGNFQMALMKWVATLDPDIYRVAFHSSEKPPGRNRGSYDNPTLDPLVAEAFKIEDETKRKKLYQEIQKIVFEDMPIIPLWYEQQVSVIKSSIEGYSPSQMGDYLPFLKVSKAATK